MDFGFADAGFNIQLANELDLKAVETYQTAHPETLTLAGSITDQKIFRAICRQKNVDIVFGGPPCQGFSVAGKMNPDDTRSQLIWTFLDVVKSVRPRAFVLENVKALGVHTRWHSTRLKLLKYAESIGYLATIVILNSSDFGVPQNRERMFMIGFPKNDVKLDSADELNLEISNRLLLFRESPETIGEIIRTLGRAGTKGNMRICRAKVTYAKNPVLRPSPYAGMMFNGAGRPVRANGVSCTLPASMGGNKTPIVDEDEIFLGKKSFIEDYHRHLRKGGKPRCGNAPSRLRRLTIDECLAIQTFPIDLEMAGTPSAIFRQIGNAVPSKLAGAVGRVVKNILDTPDKTSEPAREQFELASA